MASEREFGAVIRNLRERAGLSRVRLAGMAGVSDSYLHSLEQGYVLRRGRQVPVRNVSEPVVRAVVDALAAGLQAAGHHLPDAERRRILGLAGYPQPEPHAPESPTGPETYGLTPEQARELASLPAAKLLRILEEVGGIRVRGSADQDHPVEQTQDRRGQN